MNDDVWYTCKACGFKDRKINPSITSYRVWVIDGECNICRNKRIDAQDFAEAQRDGTISRDNEIMCPYCGDVNEDSWEYSKHHTYTCPNCDEESDLEVEYTANYTTTKREKK